MITGDNALTACHIAKEVEIVSRDVLIADQWTPTQLEWRSVDEEIVIPLDLSCTSLPKTLFKYDLCVTGAALSRLETNPILFGEALARLWVYARVSPSQKEMILVTLKEAGYTTLMCGDGTNDVGALKQAHVGIALLDGTEEDIKKIAEHQVNLRKKAILQRQEVCGCGGIHGLVGFEEEVVDS
jgi:cation-transporting ATPase 13A1